MRHTSIGLILTCLLLAGMVTTTKAVVKYSSGNGYWHVAGTWEPAGQPTDRDTAIIMESHNVSVHWGGPVALRLVINKGGKLTYDINVNLTIGGQLLNMGTLDGTYPLPGYTLSVGDTLKNYPGATMIMFKHPLTVAGPFINEGSFSTSSGSVLAGGEFSNSGSFAVGAAPLTFQRNFKNDSAGTFTITGSAECGFWGDFTNHQADANFGTGTATFSSSANSTIRGTAAPTFRTMVVNKSGGSLTLASDLTVQNGGLSVNAGALAVSEHTLTLGTASAAGHVVVGVGGTFTAVGPSTTARAVVTTNNSSHPYAFVVDSGGTIAARNARFRWMNADGIVVNDGASVTPTNNFSNCSFAHGDIDGPMLKVENSQVINMEEVDFDGSTGYNIEKLTDAGRISVASGTGTRWGAEHENDPFNRIAWGAGAIGEQTGFPTESGLCAATVARGVLRLAVDSRQRAACRADLLGITGRKVAELVPGPNDVSGLTPGVYFVRSETGNRLARVVIAK